MINHLDDCIASILEQWRGYGSPDGDSPLYILFSSDHGEMLGDHQLFRKSLGYEASARVPFFITGQNVSLPSTTSADLVCWEDIAPTILDLAGVEVPPSMEGISLAPHIRGETPPAPRDHIFGQCQGHYHNLWIVTPRWKYLWFPSTNEEQLFDLSNDPQENHDASGESTALGELRERMASHLQNRDDLTYDPDRLIPCSNRPPRVFWSHQTS